MSWSNNSVISGSVSLDSLSFSGCEFQLLCLSGHLLLDASCCDFYPVGYWIFLPFVLGHISLFGDSWFLQDQKEPLTSPGLSCVALPGALRPAHGHCLGPLKSPPCLRETLGPVGVSLPCAAAWKVHAVSWGIGGLSVATSCPACCPTCEYGCWPCNGAQCKGGSALPVTPSRPQRASSSRAVFAAARLGFGLSASVGLAFSLLQCARLVNRMS